MEENKEKRERREEEGRRRGREEPVNTFETLLTNCGNELGLPSSIDDFPETSRTTHYLIEIVIRKVGISDGYVGFIRH